MYVTIYSFAYTYVTMYLYLRTPSYPKLDTPATLVYVAMFG